jgi:prepilin-type N-terminal cleavage/methylation domain-containing protein
MTKRPYPRRAGRRGFTLVEMLVVIGIFLLLGALTVAFLANFRGSSASQATSQLYGWLSQARQRAIRDRNPYGLRLVLNPNNPGQVDQLQYIEQPEDFYIPGIFSDVCSATSSNASQYVAIGYYSPKIQAYYLAQFSQNVDFTGGFSQDPALWPVQPGDYLEVNGSGKVHRIASKLLGDKDSKGIPFDGVNYFVPPATSNISGLILVSQPDMPTGTGWQYRVLRRPRVVGEDALRLPQGVVIDLGLTGSSGYSPLTAAPNGFDILFGPKGQVIGSAAAYDKIILWVRNTAGVATDPTYDPNLVVINTRSGAIASYRVDMTLDANGNFVDAFSETRSGQTSPQ